MDKLISVLEWINPNSHEGESGTRISTRYLRLWGYYGLWHSEESRRGWLPYIYARLVLVIQGLNIALYAKSLTAPGNSLTKITEQVIILLFIVMGLVKIATYVFQPIRIKELSRDLESLHGRSHREGIPEVNDLLRKAGLFSKFCAVYFPLSGVALAISTVVVLVGKALYTRRPVFRSQYPCDIAYSPCLELTILNDALLSFTTLQFMCLADIYLLDIMNHIWTHSKILKLNLKSIRTYAIKMVDESIQSEAVMVSRVVPRFPMTLEGGARLHEVSISMQWGAEAGRTANIGGGVLDFSVLGTYAEKRAKKMAARRLAINQAMEVRLAECVRYHQTILSAICDLETLYNPFLMSQLSSNLIASAIIALHIVMIPSWGLIELGMICIEIILFTVFFNFTWMSNAITSECSKVKMAVYESDWLEASDSFKRSMRIIMSRANERVVIRVGGLTPLSLETYHNISKTAVSHFLTMRTIASKE